MKRLSGQRLRQEILFELIVELFVFLPREVFGSDDRYDTAERHYGYRKADEPNDPALAASLSGIFSLNVTPYAAKRIV